MINRCIGEHSPNNPTRPGSPENIPGNVLVSTIGTNESRYEGLRKYAVSEFDLGACSFFKGIALSHLNKLNDSMESITVALNSPFAAEKETETEEGELSIEKIEKIIPVNEDNEQTKLEYLQEHNRMLCYFAIAKIYQRNKEHVLAVQFFTKALAVLPMDSDRAFLYFRRAWSYKVRERTEGWRVVERDKHCVRVSIIN